MKISIDFESPVGAVGPIACDLSTISASSSSKKIVPDKEKWYCCPFPDCSKAFRFKSEFQRHNITHSDHRPYLCIFEGCGKTFKRLDTLQIHLRFHEGIKPFECEFPGCNYKAASKSSLNYHSLKHENLKQFKCKIPGCNKFFTTKAHLKQHGQALKYHTRIKEKNELLEEHRKIKKQNSFNDCNNQPIKVKPHIIDRFFDRNERKTTLTIPSADETEINIEMIINKLQKENDLLRKALEVRSELNKRFESDDEPVFQQKEMMACDHDSDKNVIFDEKDFELLAFLREKEREEWKEYQL